MIVGTRRLRNRFRLTGESSGTIITHSRYPGFEGIVLNSSLIQHPESAAEDAARQERWREAELAAARQAHATLIAVFQHIAFFIRDADESDRYFNIPKTTRAKYLDMLRQSGVQ
jgi:hypothetical protein